MIFKNLNAKCLVLKYKFYHIKIFKIKMSNFTINLFFLNWNTNFGFENINLELKYQILDQFFL
jgi:hypothetical protein